METDGLKTIRAEVDALRKKHRGRDQRASEVREVRHGNFDKVAPNLFSDEWPRSTVANRIDVAARHGAAALTPLPIISCSPEQGASDRARASADKRSKIANHYLTRVDYQRQMQQGADQFWSYGMIVTSVDPNFDEHYPEPIIEDSSGFYPVFDRLGRTVKMVRVFTRSLIDLMSEFPEASPRLTEHFGRGGEVQLDREVEVVKYVSAQRIVMYVDKSEIVLVDAPNALGRCTYVATKRPGLDDEIRGNFDDLVWVQLALHAMQQYTLAAAAQAVEAPIVAPNDVLDIAFGPGQVIRTNDPQNVRRLAIDVPNGAWTASQYLSSELEYGAIVPEALGGSIDASVVTGKGVQQLMAGYSQQISNAQIALQSHFAAVISLCFEMDEKFWPEISKSIRGTTDGAPYKETYRAGRDISGDYSVDVVYGGFAGLDPNRSLVAILQSVAAGLLSEDYARRNLPVQIDPAQEERKIQVERLRKVLIARLELEAQQPSQPGQDPSEMISKIAEAIDMIAKGDPAEKVMQSLFPKPQPTPMDAATQAAQAAGAPPDQVAAGQAAGPDQGGRPPLQMLFAGLSPSGNANLQAGVSRMEPARA